MTRPVASLPGLTTANSAWIAGTLGCRQARYFVHISLRWPIRSGPSLGTQWSWGRGIPCRPLESRWLYPPAMYGAS
jgi:hypothetical protein